MDDPASASDPFRALRELWRHDHASALTEWRELHEEQMAAVEARDAVRARALGECKHTLIQRVAVNRR